jgi:hypothetical protein
MPRRRSDKNRESLSFSRTALLGISAPRRYGIEAPAIWAESAIPLYLWRAERGSNRNTTLATSVVCDGIELEEHNDRVLRGVCLVARLAQTSEEEHAERLAQETGQQ